MTVKRVIAAVAAVAMIAIAWTVRNQIDRPDPDELATTANSGQVSDAPATDKPTNDGGEVASEIVCSPDLIRACENAAAASGLQLSITSDNIDALLAKPADGPAVWVTLDPLPAALETVDPSVGYTTTPLAASPISLIVAADRAPALTATCGAAVGWRCLGDHAGQPWAAIGGDPSWSTLRPGVSSDRTAIGAVSITQAVRSYFGSTSINAADPSFIAWARGLGGTVPPSSLSAGTAVGTIQVRPSLLDAAVGVPAELAHADDSRFTVVGMDPASTATVVLATREGHTAPTEFVDALRNGFIADGWSAPDKSDPAGVRTSGGDMVAALAAWNDVQK